MKLKKLGRTGALVSELCFGTMTFGWQADEETSHRMLDRFTEAGGNFLDSSNVYSAGKSEEIIGKWLARQERQNVVLATKARFRTSGGANNVGLSRKHLFHAVADSLRRLQTDYIDLLQVHAWDPLTPLEETFGALHTLVEDGSVRYVGVSNYRAWQLEKALQLCRSRGWHEPVSLQPQVQPVRTGHRVRAYPGVPGRGRRSAALEPSGERSPFRKVPGWGTEAPCGIPYRRLRGC